jgi:hypothetical protein
MRAVFIVAGSVILAAIAGVYLLPAVGMASASSGLAHTALSAGYPRLAAAVLKPAAAAGDPLAMNDLGVLFHKGVGVEADPAEAARLLSTAAETGLPRARLNLIVALTPQCATSSNDQVFDQFEALALAGDTVAASFAADCIGDDRINAIFARKTPSWADRLLTLAEIGSRGDANEKVKFAWLLVAAVGEIDNVKAPGADDRALSDKLLNLAARLLVEARPDKPAAYYGLSTFRDVYSDRLEKGPVADEIMAQTADEWLLAGAKAGHMTSRCAIMTTLSERFLADPTETTYANLQAIVPIMDQCLFNRTNPRDVIFVKEGNRTIARPYGHDFTVDRWRAESPLLVATPKYADYDFSRAIQERAVDTFNKVRRKLGR